MRSQGRRLKAFNLMSLVKGPKALVALSAKKKRKEAVIMSIPEKYGLEIGREA